MEKPALETLMKKMLEEHEQESRKIENENVLSIEEWNSFSKERQDSIVMFVMMCCENVSVEESEKIDFNLETRKYMAKNGLLKLVKRMSDAI